MLNRQLFDRAVLQVDLHLGDPLHVVHSRDVNPYLAHHAADLSLKLPPHLLQFIALAVHQAQQGLHLAQIRGLAARRVGLQLFQPTDGFLLRPVQRLQ
jgi:hypothetical protein